MPASNEPVLSVLVLSEDTGAQTHATLVALFRKMLYQVDERIQSQKVDYRPADEESQRALRGKFHSGHGSLSYRSRIVIASMIADHISRDDVFGLVAYHSDADRRWSDMTVNDFPDFSTLLDAVRHRLAGGGRAVVHVTPSRIERVFLLGAYWEVESWLYQNIDVAMRICEMSSCSKHRNLFETWKSSRSLLDEQENPKDVCCLSDRHNQALAEKAYPIGEAYGAGTSLTATVDRLRDSPDLVAAIKRTYE